MEELWGKLTNLSYELFGVFVPGAILLLFLILWWFAIGEIPFLESHSLVARLQSVDDIAGSFLLIAVTAALIYFCGHLLVWISRKSAPYEKRILLRVARSLHFRIPESYAKYDSSLTQLLNASASNLGIPIDNHTWPRFYPLAKIILGEKLGKSLVSIYQNKYTLHRSIAASAAVLFWLCGATLLVGAFACFPAYVHWIAVIALMLGSLVLVWGFSASFAYYWRMWGNTIITETYAVLSGVIK